ncbi:MAG: RIP metalloprotease RseP [Rhodospirillales bacterium]
MEFLNFTWYYIVVFLFVLTVLVFVHELGHFWIARRNGVRVEVFSVGFGPELFGRTDSLGTRWRFSAIPLGGYVKMFGEYDFEDSPEAQPMTAEEQKVSFHHKNVRQRSAIVFAGPAANFLFAIVLLGLLFGLVGSPRPLAGVGGVQEGSAAEAAGLRPGDRIKAIAGQDIVWFEDLRQAVEKLGGQTVSIAIQRGDNLLSLTVTPTLREVTHDDGTVAQKGLLGVSPDPEQLDYVRYDPLTAAWMGVERTFAMVGQILSYLGDIIGGDRNTDELGGPLRIAQMSGQVAQGGFVDILFFMAALSINLGLINLFPVPMLDGGHLVFYGIEALRGRPLNAKAQEYGFRFGLALVLLLMVFVTWKDLGHLGVIDFIKHLFT